MTPELALAITQEALWTSLLIAGPVLAAALVVGTTVSVLQTVTQVQEVTLVFVPKIAATLLVVAFAGGWMLEQTVAFATRSFMSIGP